MNCLYLFLHSNVLILLFVLQYTQLYILQNQLQLDGALVTIPQFFSGSEIKRIPWSEPNSKECTGINSTSCNGFWSCTEEICNIGLIPDTRYVITYPLGNWCNQTYESYLSRIKSEETIYYYNFIHYGSTVLMYTSMFCGVLTICLIIITYCLEHNNVFVMIFYCIVVIIYVNILLLTIAMFIYERKFVTAQERSTGDYIPNLIRKSSKNINTICIVMLATQLIIGLIEYYQLFDNINHKQEQLILTHD
jgi:hypothetical protein